MEGKPNRSDELLPTRESLLSRLKSWEDQASWKEFFATYWKLIYTAAIRSGLTDAEAQDVVQETVLAVCKQMPKFQYDPKIGSFKGWLLQLTQWRIRDQFRKRLNLGATNPETGTTDLVGGLPDPGVNNLEVLWESEWDKTILAAALERVKQKVDPKQFQIFDMYVLNEWAPAKICALLNVSRGSVYLAKYRISRLLKKEVEHLKTNWL